MIFRLSPHLLHADEVAGVAVARRRADDLEVEVGVGQVRLVLAQVADHAAGPRDRPGAAQVDRVLLASARRRPCVRSMKMRLRLSSRTMSA